MENLKNKIKELGWNVYEIDFCDGKGWELEKYSPAGEDFIFQIEHNQTVEKAIENIKEYVNNFDEDEHARLWATARDVGQPTTLKELIQDAENIHNMLYELANNL